MPRVSKEYSGVAIFLIFIILATSLAFSPQVGGVPRAISQAYVPTAISASSLPIGGSSLTAHVGAWLDAIHWMQGNVKSTDAVVMWWDYGNWLSDLGNVTSLADNTTTNSTQIENVGFIFMGNENQSMAMLNSYGQNRVKYIAVFETLLIQTTSSSSSYVAGPANYGDEGKWVWMARISGQGKDRLLNEGFMNTATAWTNETQFGASDPTTNKWKWNDQGLNCTVFELLNYAEVDYAQTMTTALTSQGISITPDQTTTVPTYFQKAYTAGLNTAPGQYGGLIPLIAIYKIDWASYDAQHGITPPS